MFAFFGQKRCSPALHIFNKILKRIFVVFGELAIFNLPIGFVDCGPKRERVQQIRRLIFIQAVNQIAKLFFRRHTIIMSSTEIMRRHSRDLKRQRLDVVQLQRNRALLILQKSFH